MNNNENEYSLKKLIQPLTTFKVIHILIFLGIIIFANSLFNDFVGDDFGQIVQNNLIHSIYNIPLFFKISTFSLNNGISGIYYKPLILTSYALIYTFFGQTPFFFHLLQVILFILNDILLFLFLKKFLKIQWAFILSVIFLVHPINEDIASYIANLQDGMYFFFGMIALLITTYKNNFWEQYFVYIMLIFSLLSKETGLVFVLINILYISFFKPSRIKKSILFSAILILIYVTIHYLVVGTHFVMPLDFPIGRLPLLIRMLSVPKIIEYYLVTLFYPFHLAVSDDWTVTHINILNFFVPVFIIMLIGAFILYAGKYLHKHDKQAYRIYIFFTLWFICALGFHLQIIPLDATVAPHWFYLPFAGLLGMIGVMTQTIYSKPFNSRIFIVVFIFLITLLSTLTILRNHDFSNNLTLTCHDADVAEDNAALENSCGASLFRSGQTLEAQQHLELAVKLAPYSALNWYSLGTLLGARAEQEKKKNLLVQAEKDLNISIQNGPSIPYAYETQGYIYANYKDTNSANIFLTKAIKLFPSDYKLWLYLAVVQYKAHDINASLKSIKIAYELNPTDPDVQKVLYVLSKNSKIKIENKSL